MRTLTAAEAITAGKLVYRVTARTAGIADASIPAKAAVAGIAVNTATTGQPVTFVESDPALVLGGTHWVGLVYGAGEAGAMMVLHDQMAADWKAVTLGVVISATTMKFEVNLAGVAYVSPFNPAAPGDLTASGDAIEITASWTQDGEVTRHVLQIQETGGAWETLIVDVTATSPYVFATPPAGEYDIRVRAVIEASGMTQVSEWTTANLSI